MRRSGYNKLAKQGADRLYKFVLFHVKDEAVSQDIVQEAFLKLWECRKEVNEEKALAWLFSTARNLFLNHVRHQKVVQNQNPAFQYDAYIENAQFENNDLIRRCMENMPEAQKTILLLRDLEGYDYKSIGQIVGLSESQVKVYLFRARKRFRDMHAQFQQESKGIQNG